MDVRRPRGRAPRLFCLIRFRSLPLACFVLESVKPRVALIFPVTNLLENMRDFQVSQIFCVLVANFRRDCEAKGRTVLASERLIVHFVAKQSLRMQRGSHIKRLVIVIGTLDRDEAGSGIDAYKFEKFRKRCAAEASDHVPAFNADVPRVLLLFGERLDIGEFVVAGMLHGTTHSEAPVFKNHARIVDVVIVDGKSLERRELGSSKGGGKMTGTKQLTGCPVAECQTLLQQRLAKSGNRKRAECDDRREL